MEDKIFDIITDLIREDITKDEAIAKLLVLFGAVDSFCQEFEQNFNNSSYCKKCGHHKQDH